MSRKRCSSGLKITLHCAEFYHYTDPASVRTETHTVIGRVDRSDFTAFRSRNERLNDEEDMRGAEPQVAAKAAGQP